MDLKVGTKFASYEDFKESVHEYEKVDGSKLHSYRTGQYYNFECIWKSCPVFLRGRLQIDGSIKLKRVCLEHSRITVFCNIC